MSTVPNRTDRAHDIQYPTSADGRGSTRVNHLRRPYYFGPYDSPQSYIMFGLWKHLLVTSGEVPETKDLRPLVDEFLGKKPEVAPSDSNKLRFFPSVLISSILLSLAFMGVAVILSTNRAPRVDDQAMTATEMDFIRQMRNGNEDLARRFDAVPVSNFVDLSKHLIAAGAKNGLQHVRRARD